jgi:cysteine desulfurase / selenocysteine lyase
MDAATLQTWRTDFPGLDGWHYLDSAASAQKPQTVIDATVKALGRDYATVHRGVYARSAEMTLAFEAARRRVAGFIGGAEEELVFTRGATEAINLVAYSGCYSRCWSTIRTSSPGSWPAGRSMSAP